MVKVVSAGSPATRVIPSDRSALEGEVSEDSVNGWRVSLIDDRPVFVKPRV